MDFLQNYLRAFVDRLPSTAQLRAFGLTQVPLLFLVLPKVEKIDDNASHVRINLNWLTKNHLNSMYFGTLSIGADAVVAILAMNQAKAFPESKILPVFKDLKVSFLKRAETDVLFICEEGQKIKTMVQQAKDTGQRVTEPIFAKAVNVNDHSDVYAEFVLSLSLKSSRSK